MKVTEKLFCDEITKDLKVLLELISKVDKTEAIALFSNSKDDWRDHNALRKMLSQEAKLICKKYGFEDLWKNISIEKKDS